MKTEREREREGEREGERERESHVTKVDGICQAGRNWRDYGTQ